MDAFYQTYRSLIGECGVSALYAYSLYIMMRAGQMSLGHVAFGAAGAYTAAILTTEHGVPLGLALLAGMAVALVLSLVLGAVVMRLGTVFLAIATLGFGEVIRITLNNLDGLTGGALGYPVYGAQTPMILIWLAVAACCWFMFRMRGSRLGRSIDAVGSDETAARTQGMNVTAIRLVAFAISGLVAGLAGGLDAHFVSFVQPSSFGLFFGLDVLMYVIVGGVARWWGPLVGAIAMSLLPTVLRELGVGAGWVGLACQGAVLLIVIIVLPGGLSSLAPARKRRSRASATFLPESAPLPLAVDGLVVRFGGVVAVNGVDLKIRAGEIHGLVGPNGAGKTTLVNAITRLQANDGGRIRIGDVTTTDLTPHRVARVGVARTFQHIRLFEDLSVLDNVTAGITRDRSNDLLGRILMLPSAARTDRANQGRALAALALLGLDDVAEKPVAGLPYGARRRVEMARAIASGPGLLVLDEPAAGMNQTEAMELVDIIHRIAETGCTVVLIEHNMQLVHAACDSVTVLAMGETLTTGTPGDALSDERVTEAYIGA